MIAPIQESQLICEHFCPIQLWSWEQVNPQFRTNFFSICFQNLKFNRLIKIPFCFWQRWSWSWRRRCLCPPRRPPISNMQSPSFQSELIIPVVRMTTLVLFVLADTLSIVVISWPRSSWSSRTSRTSWPSWPPLWCDVTLQCSPQLCHITRLLVTTLVAPKKPVPVVRTS